MPRDEDKAWEFVERLEGGKWRCPHCPKESSGQVTGVKCHLLGIKGRGIGICTKVPNDKRDQLLSLLKNEGDPLLSLLKEEACSGEANRHSSTGGAAGTSCQQSLGEQHQFHQSSTLPSVAQDKHFIANEQPASVHAPHYQDVSSDKLLAHSDPQQASAVNMANHPSWMPPQLQIICQSSHTVPNQSINFEAGDQQQNQRMSSSLQNDQFLTNGASDGLQESIQTGVLATDPLNDIPTTNIRKESYQPNHTFCGQHGGESLSSSPMYSTSWPFSIEDIPTNDAMDPAEISSLGNEKSLQTGTSSFLQDCREPCALEVVNTAQHSNQPHPRCDGESGIETNLFPSQDSVGVDPQSALQHSSDPHVSEKSNVNLQGPTDGINTAAQSIPSLDMNRGSPMLNQISICANHEKMKNLKRKFEQLEGREADIKKKMKLESTKSLPQMKPKTMVTKWLKKIKTARNKFKSINEVSGENMPLKERVERLTREVEELRGKKLPRTLFIQAEPAKRPALLEHKLIGEAIQRNIELIWGCLMENRSSNLGISGMGGVGKTTIVEHIHNRLLKNGNFDTAIFCTVSQNFSIHKLQSDIWKELKGSDMEEERVTKRAAKLSEDLSKKKNFVLILDDVWEHFELRDVGIPHIADGCKLVLTTRSSEVCARMGCKKIEIRPLREEEAWNLFVEHLGYNGVLEKIKEVAKAIVEKCAGLPLAIIAMARSMRGEVRSFYWKDTLDQLNDPKKDHTEMGDRVLPVLRHSYTRLSPQLQQCFLRCALYPEDASIGKMELIEFFIDEGLIDELHTREKQHNRGLTIISRLQDAFLLEDSYWGIKMHDLLRDMALHIMSTTSIVEVRMPDEERWTSDLERVSLMNRINKIPPDMSPNCPKLSTLLLKDRILDHIPDSFFKQLQGLKVLNLSRSKITKLPSSVSDLVNLRALVLCWCYRLCHVPYLGKLKSLRKLDALGCIKLEAVEGLQMLANLRYLDLFRTGVKKLQKGTLRSSVKLQHLKIQGRVNAEEMTELKALELFECRFDTVDEFSLSLKILGEIGYNDFKIKVNQVNSSFYVKMAHYDPENCIHEHSSTVRVHLEKLNIQRCLKLKYLFGHECKLSLPDLGAIVIRGCEEIEGITAVAAGSLVPAFPSLKMINVKSCDNMKRVVESERLLHFPNLKEIKVQGCKKMVEIIGRPPPCMPVDTAVLDVSPLLKLEFLHIIEGENLQVLCGAADEQEVTNGHSYSLLFPCLKELYIQRCLKLKYLLRPGCKLSLPDLRAIVIEGCEEIEGITAAAAGSMVPAFPSLERINVKSCGKMKRVLESEWLLHFPNLKEIKVQGCKKMVEIIGRPPPCMPVDTAVLDVSPLLKLEFLEIIEGENLQVLCGAADEQEVTNGHSYSLLFSCLKELYIQRCLKLKYLFGPGCKLSLPGLRAIVIKGCEEIEGITAAAAGSLVPAFPSLERINVKSCGKMKRVLESEWLLHFPNLKEIKVRGCKKMVEIIGRPPPCMPVDTAVLDVSPLLKLELLEIIEGENLQVLCGAADEQEVINGHSYSLLFPRLKKLNIQRCLKLKYLVGHGCKLSLPDLRAIVIEGCEEIEGITALAAGSLHPAFPSLETIDVKSCGNMKGIVESEWLLLFRNLKKIKVQGCKKMVEIIGQLPPCMPVDTALLLRHLQVEHCNIQNLLPLELLPHLRNLQRIHVNDCTGMEEIVSRGSASTPEHIPSSPYPFHSLPQLEHLLIENLPNLKSICESTISCLSINSLRVSGCPKLGRISLQLKVVRQGMDMPKINLDRKELWDTLEWDGAEKDQFVSNYVRAYNACKNRDL
ncbi:uncharacterized protein LOC104455540 isoform X2 [Eucalyptus grandis]|uniref:uncharacterized protein LOC104455540 isoform X2 n=1 Tax=Eucalyptus grandis TaxID=71139 RepID=UPI00192EA9D7|nr:uncharacterized protein LOC104455540 isoform X2 [Eucalyptus grandis]XP_039174164.1 uncharacterized protein LOC104455540 isoform X2 [Eucalyptus grandis]XP_039174165.1 uncharacterized protein LOC104455540 isoform X2 [Eucalyptus grandis]